mgnify:FL=1
MRGVAFQESAVFPVPALGAKALILDIIHCVDSDLRTLKDELAVDLAAVADGLAPAGADSFQLLDRMGDLQQPGRAGKAAHHEISPQAVADDRNAQIDRDKKQLVGLLGREKLALIAKHAGNFAVGGLIGPDQLRNVHLGGDELIHLAADTQPGDDRVLPFCVDGRLENQHPHTALFIVVGDLHQGSGFAAVHCAVPKI